MNRLILRRLRTFSALGPKAVRARQSAVEKTHALCTLNRSTSSMAKVPARGKEDCWTNSNYSLITLAKAAIRSCAKRASKELCAGSMQLQNWHTSLPGMTKPSSSQHQIVRHSTGISGALQASVL